jgi:hypothetical protein
MLKRRRVETLETRAQPLSLIQVREEILNRNLGVGVVEKGGDLPILASLRLRMEAIWIAGGSRGRTAPTPPLPSKGRRGERSKGKGGGGSPPIEEGSPTLGILLRIDQMKRRRSLIV